MSTERTVLIVAAEEGHGRMMPQSQHIALGFLLDALEELGEDRVDTARKHDSKDEPRIL